MLKNYNFFIFQRKTFAGGRQYIVLLLKPTDETCVEPDEETTTSIVYFSKMPLNKLFALSLYEIYYIFISSLIELNTVFQFQHIVKKKSLFELYHLLLVSLN